MKLFIIILFLVSGLTLLGQKKDAQILDIRKLPIALLIALTVSCKSPSDKRRININKNDSIEQSSTDETESSLAKPLDKTPDKGQDCVFDLSSQTDEFMKDIPNYPDYKWDDQKKTATVIFDNGDTIKIIRGGCTHFNFYIEFISKKTDSLTIDNPEYALNFGKDLAQKIFPAPDYQLIDSLITNVQFEVEQTYLQYYMDFNQDVYCDMTVIMQESKSGKFRLEIGYYFC